MGTPVLAISFSLLLLSVAALAQTGTIGINYGRVGNNLPTPEKVVQLLKSQGITRVKLYDTDATVLTAFSGSGITLTVALPNELLPSAASDQSFTDTWLQSTILPYYPSTSISAIAVGNEVFSSAPNSTDHLVPAMTNLFSSLQKHNLHTSIKLSSPIALSSLENSYPPSSGSFKTDLIEPVIKPMLDFLRKTSSVLMVNAYPFFAYSSNSDKISLDYALFRDNSGVVDQNNGLAYHSLFEAQIDAVFAAMSKLQYDDVNLAVTETGWPSIGDENEIGANKPNAAAYNGNLVRRVLTGSGSPLRPNKPLNVYLFALFNEDEKPGPTSERNYGLFYPDEERVYDIQLTLEQLGAGENGSKAVVTPAPAIAPSSAPAIAPSSARASGTMAGQTWCVANGKAPVEQLQRALDYACGEGQADCRAIQPGGACYDPNSLEAHASYAFNSYYQMKSRGAGTCNFGGTAYVVTQPPRFGNCQFPTGY
ncbi:hypothetical protein Ancab_004474 [Ancistrocladus abbreviatus]